MHLRPLAGSCHSRDFHLGPHLPYGLVERGEPPDCCPGGDVEGGCECPHQGHGICFRVSPLIIWETSVRLLTLSVQSIFFLFSPSQKFALGFLCTPAYNASSGVTASRILLPQVVLGNDDPSVPRHNRSLTFPLPTSNQTLFSPSLLTYQHCARHSVSHSFI